MQLSIKTQYEMIALESATAVMAPAGTIARLPDFFAAAKKTIFSFFKTDSKYVAFDGRAYRNQLDQLTHTDYNVLRGLEFPVPPGLRVPFITYSTALYTASTHTAEIQTKLLDPFASWLRARLGAPITLASLSTPMVLDKKLLSSLDDDIVAIGEMFQSNGVIQAKRPYEQIVRANSEWRLVMEQIGQANALFTDKGRALMIRSAEEITDLLDRLIDRHQSDSETYKMSGANLKSLASATYAVASSIEKYALIRTRLLELTVATEDCMAQLKKLR